MQSARGNRLKELREEHGAKLVEVAASVDKDQSSMWRYETGRAPVPDEVKLKLAERYGVTVPHLMGWDRAVEPEDIVA